MSLSWPFIVLSSLSFGISLWLFRLNRALSSTPPEAARFAGKPWTDEQIFAFRDQFEQKKHDDFIKYLPPKQNRRYVVVGGSGLVGGWIVEHLVIRGEDAQGIRIADITAPRREHALKAGVPYIRTDVTDPASLARLFDRPWAPQVAKLPLTVFHTVAMIHPGHRKPATVPPMWKITVDGTRNVLAAARAAGCDIFINTSSVVVGLKPMNLLAPPWKSRPDHFVQVVDNADPQDLDAPLEKWSGTYAYTKAKAEQLVRNADDKDHGFRTGSIRPGHTIYGHGDENPSCVINNNLMRGGFPSWTTPYLLQFVSAQNVSLAHLLFEARMHGHDLGGNAYAVVDPNPPLRYGDIMRFMGLLAHPATPMAWPPLPPVALVLAAYAIEFYVGLQRDHLPFLPPLSRDLTVLQPAVLSVSTAHFIYGDARTRAELGYASGHTTPEGVYLVVKEWNEKVEARLAAGKPARP